MIGGSPDGQFSLFLAESLVPPRRNRNRLAVRTELSVMVRGPGYAALPRRFGLEPAAVRRPLRQAQAQEIAYKHRDVALAVSALSALQHEPRTEAIRVLRALIGSF